ncbi:hemolysin family protein [Rubrivirga sp. IMCC45206]|uniref:hemolysin family protein n=1 Tax=Rubrivirga sp. IMCC45206 TaxID=3391614 RepID=UPI00398FA573
MDPDSSPALAAQLLADVLPGPAGLAVQIGVFVLLLGLSALFSGSEVALFSLGASEREALREDGGREAARVLVLLDRPRRLLAAILLLNTVVNVGAAILSTQLMVGAAETYGWNPLVALAANVVGLTFVLLVTSEIAPKLAASRAPSRFARSVAPFLSPLVRAVTPVADLLAGLASFVQARLRREAEPLSSDDIKSMADVGEAQGSIGEEERALIHSIVEFGETTVREVMVSRVDVRALADDATLEDALELIRETGHSRFPLYHEHLDNVLGVVYAKDLLPSLDGAGVTPDWAVLARKPLFVPPGKTLDDMLADFQASNTHMALVVDEYGGTAGLVTLEDLLEEVVGEIYDELDADEEQLVEPVAPGVYRAEARVDLDDLADTLGIEMDTDDFDFETLGGLILHLAGDIPEPGDEVSYAGLTLRVEAVQDNRILSVRVETAATEAEAPTDPAR